MPVKTTVRIIPVTLPSLRSRGLLYLFYRLRLPHRRRAPYLVGISGWYALTSCGDSSSPQHAGACRGPLLRGFAMTIEYNQPSCRKAGGLLLGFDHSSVSHPQPQPPSPPFWSVTLGGKNSSVGKSRRENISHGLSVEFSQRFSGIQKS